MKFKNIMSRRKILSWRAAIVLLVFNLASIAYGQLADNSDHLNLGDAAKNASGALMGIFDLVLSVTSISGVVFCCVSVAKLYQHKKNPQQVPISQFFIMLVLGLVLLGLPYILKHGNSAYSML